MMRPETKASSFLEERGLFREAAVVVLVLLEHALDAREGLLVLGFRGVAQRRHRVVHVLAELFQLSMRLGRAAIHDTHWV